MSTTEFGETAGSDPAYLTIIILSVSVTGGLFLTIVSIFFCKYCKNRNINGRSDPSYITEENGILSRTHFTLPDIPENEIIPCNIESKIRKQDSMENNEKKLFVQVDLPPVKELKLFNRRYTEGDFEDLTNIQLSKAPVDVSKTLSVSSPLDKISERNFNKQENLHHLKLQISNRPKNEEVSVPLELEGSKDLTPDMLIRRKIAAEIHHDYPKDDKMHTFNKNDPTPILKISENLEKSSILTAPISKSSLMEIEPDGDYKDLWHLRCTLENDISEPNSDLELTSQNEKHNQNIKSNSDFSLDGIFEKTEYNVDKDKLTIDKRTLIKLRKEKIHIFSSTEESDTSEQNRYEDKLSSGGVKLKQNRDDSGYMSIELKHLDVARNMFTSGDTNSISEQKLEEKKRNQNTTNCGSASLESIHTPKAADNFKKAKDESDRMTKSFDIERNVFKDKRTASTKRKDFITGSKGKRYFASLSFSGDENQLNSEESLSVSSEKPYYDICKESGRSNKKNSRFSLGRFLQRESKEDIYCGYSLSKRDFCIDEKTDVLFKKFLRQDSLMSSGVSNQIYSMSGNSCTDSQLVTTVSSKHKSREGNSVNVPSGSQNMGGAKKKQSRSFYRLISSDSIEEKYLKMASELIWTDQDSQAKSSQKESLKNKNKSKNENKRLIAECKCSNYIPEKNRQKEIIIKGAPLARSLELDGGYEDICRSESIPIIRKNQSFSSPERKNSYISKI